jgi:hypothetical protein
MAETEQISRRRVSPLYSRAQIFVGESIFRRAQKKFALEIQYVTMKQNNRVG